MPYLSIITNKTITNKEQVIRDFSKKVAEMIGKPERYVMVSLQDTIAISFAGTNEACAYLEFKSIGLPHDQTGVFSATLCQMIEETAGIAKDRIYIEFADAPRKMWGWNGSTF